MDHKDPYNYSSILEQLGKWAYKELKKKIDQLAFEEQRVLIESPSFIFKFYNYINFKELIKNISIKFNKNYYNLVKEDEIFYEYIKNRISSHTRSVVRLKVLENKIK